MWLCTKYGFFSVVEKSPGKFHVRARVRNDLENLREAFAASTPGRLPAIRTWVKGDYRYRIVTDLQHVRALFVLLAESITYSNFTSEIATREDQHEKLSLYQTFWSDLATVQKTAASQAQRTIPASILARLDYAKVLSTPVREDPSGSGIERQSLLITRAEYIGLSVGATAKKGVFVVMTEKVSIELIKNAAPLITATFSLRRKIEA